MKTYAVKKAKAIQVDLPDEFILEYADISLFPEGFHKVEDGFEFMSQEELDLALINNPQIKSQHEADKLASKIEYEQSDEYKNMQAEAIRKEQEYRDFLAWKASQES